MAAKKPAKATARTKKAPPKPTAPKNPLARGPGGRPSFAPTDKDRSFVRAMVMAGIQQDRVAEVIDIAPKTLRKHFRDELDLGMDKANATVVANLYRQAIKDDFRSIPAAIYWTKAQMGWSDKSQVEHTGAGGGPIQHIDLSNLSDGQLENFSTILTAIAGPTGRDDGGGQG